VVIARRFKAIGVVHSPFKRAEDIPMELNADPHGFEAVESEIEIFSEFEPGLKDLDGFSHLLVVFVFHAAGEARLLVRPPFETELRGVFATRSPHRPNPIGLTVVKLLGRTGAVLRVSGFDAVESTPVLDIKPYTRKDQKADIRTGWIKN
jgi:tRNA-Thr(GGU) m(6)t(6)A37 methyltransferase TsaA